MTLKNDVRSMSANEIKKNKIMKSIKERRERMAKVIQNRSKKEISRKQVTIFIVEIVPCPENFTLL
jgi:hypothetical protein